MGKSEQLHAIIFMGKKWKCDYRERDPVVLGLTYSYVIGSYHNWTNA